MAMPSAQGDPHGCGAYVSAHSHWFPATSVLGWRFKLFVFILNTARLN